MKRLFYALVALLALAACTPDNPDGPGSGGGQGGNNNGYKPSGPITVKGIVYGGGSKTLEGVVISDGLLCVQTDKNGYQRENLFLCRRPAHIAAVKITLYDRNYLLGKYRRYSRNNRR